MSQFDLIVNLGTESTEGLTDWLGRCVRRRARDGVRSARAVLALIGVNWGSSARMDGGGAAAAAQSHLCKSLAVRVCACLLACSIQPVCERYHMGKYLVGLAMTAGRRAIGSRSSRSSRLAARPYSVYLNHSSEHTKQMKTNIQQDRQASALSLPQRNLMRIHKAARR